MASDETKVEHNAALERLCKEILDKDLEKMIDNQQSVVQLLYRSPHTSEMITTFMRPRVKYPKDFLLKFQNNAVSKPEIFQILWNHEILRGLPSVPQNANQHHASLQLMQPLRTSPSLSLYASPFSPSNGMQYTGNVSGYNYPTFPRAPRKNIHKGSPPQMPVGELTPHKMEQRQKQIEFGYRSIGYIRYISLIPKDTRIDGMPQTPRITMKVSKRVWDNEVRTWRRDLHKYDPDEKLNFVPDETTLRKIFGDDVDIGEAIKLLHEKELEYKSQLKDGLTPDFLNDVTNTQSSLFDVRGMAIRYVPGKAAEAAKKVEWHAGKSKKANEEENQKSNPTSS